MSEAWQVFFINASGIALWLGVPFLVLVWPRWPRMEHAQGRGVGWRILGLMLGGWLLQLVHRLLTVPLLVEIATRKGNPDYDGVGGNAATLLFGWLIAGIGVLPSLLLRSLVDHLRIRIKPRQRKVLMAGKERSR